MSHPLWYTNHMMKMKNEKMNQVEFDKYANGLDLMGYAVNIGSTKAYLWGWKHGYDALEFDNPFESGTFESFCYRDGFEQGACDL